MSRRRFIAGAVCPRCAKMDTIVVDMDADLRECVDCGFQEARPQAPSSSELPTRVSRGLSRRTETAAEPVRLMDLSISTKKDS
jgi:uncharacterized metal-binding protein (TIGR02443 family)